VNTNQLSLFIEQEVRRFTATKRVNDVTLKELDQRIQMEAYLREKKDAILEDRKNNVDQNDATS
jgi:hypothetical protein